jgi:CDP-diacylglycerol--serine O-phosphatidyltransferase
MLKKTFPVLNHINLPGAITTFGLLVGAVTAYLLKHGELRWAILCLFICGVLDLMDGFVASRTGKVTKFGQQADSLVDFFTCCVMPIWMVYIFFHQSAFVMIAMGFYAVCGMWRLAYYNISNPTDAEPGEKKYFSGLPVPGAMMVVTMTVWFAVRFTLPPAVMAVTFLVIGALMVSKLRLRKYGPWQQALWVIGTAFVVYVVVAGG